MEGCCSSALHNGKKEERQENPRVEGREVEGQVSGTQVLEGKIPNVSKVDLQLTGEALI